MFPKRDGIPGDDCRDLSGVAAQGSAVIVDMDAAMDVAWCGHLREWHWTVPEVTALRAFMGRYTDRSPRSLAYRVGLEVMPNLTEI